MKESIQKTKQLARTIQESGVNQKKEFVDNRPNLIQSTFFSRSIQLDGDGDDAPITIKEDEIKRAPSGKSIKYPSVTSCMTITCELEGGEKVGGHASLFGRTGADFIAAMKTEIGGTKVTKVIAQGEGASWGTHLESQATLLSGKITSKGQDVRDILRPLLVGTPEQENAFKAWLGGQFGATEVTYTEVGAGDVDI